MGEFCKFVFPHPQKPRQNPAKTPPQQELALPQTRLTGSRIRARRLALGQRQADLARAVGISPAYLNLIEHNRRRIGGKLIVDLARLLEVEPAQLTQGAEDALVSALREAGARGPEGQPDEPPEDFAGRFPGWAGLTADQARRIAALERLVETLTDRLAHDPHLAAAIHEVLTSVTAIRSAAAILSDPGVTADWQARFLRSVREESRRLSAGAEGLVAWLDSGADAAPAPLSPLDVLGVFTAEAGYHFAALEQPGAGTAAVEAVLAGAPELAEAGADDLARAMLRRYLADARAMPAGAFAAASAERGGGEGAPDPGALAAAFGVGLDAVLRRIAALAEAQGGEAGLVTCDGAGALTLRKPLAGFAFPRYGAGCPLWPLYTALARPAQPVAALVEMPGRVARRFHATAIALPRPGPSSDAPPAFEATMLIAPFPAVGAAPPRPIGSTCRTCPREGCAARREPSILRTGVGSGVGSGGAAPE